MDNWNSELDRAKLYLRQHNPQKALKSFEKALTMCPLNRQKELSKILLYLGISLKQLGQGDTALRTWNIGYRVLKSSTSAKMYKRFANAYGMVKQETDEMDDWKAFLSVQRSKYLSRRPGGAIRSLAERDMIEDLIHSTFLDLKASGTFTGKSSSEKLDLFKKVRIVFPLPINFQGEFYCTFYVDFKKKKKLNEFDPCWCGSGLPFCSCCGRIRGDQELLSDLF